MYSKLFYYVIKNTYNNKPLLFLTTLKTNITFIKLLTYYIHLIKLLKSHTHNPIYSRFAYALLSSYIFSCRLYYFVIPWTAFFSFTYPYILLYVLPNASLLVELKQHTTNYKQAKNKYNGVLIKLFGALSTRRMEQELERQFFEVIKKKELLGRKIEFNNNCNGNYIKDGRTFITLTCKTERSN